MGPTNLARFCRVPGLSMAGKREERNQVNISYFVPELSMAGK